MNIKNSYIQINQQANFPKITGKNYQKKGHKDYLE